MSDERLFDLLDLVVSDVGEAPTLEAIVDVVLGRLAKTLDLWAVWVTRMTADPVVPGPAIEVLAATTRMQTVFEPGTIVAITATDEMVDHYERSSSGRVVIHRNRSGGMGLVDAALVAEGVLVTAILPLMEGDRLVGHFALASAVEGGITDAHIPFFDGLSRGVEAHVIDLVRRIPKSVR